MISSSIFLRLRQQLQNKMKSLVRIFLFLLMTAVILSCRGRGGQKNVDVAERPQLSFPMPDAPVMLGDSEKLNYLAGNFWNQFFKQSVSASDNDTSCIGGVRTAEMEQAVANYITLLSSQSLDEACKNVRGFAAGIAASDTSGTAFKKLPALFEKYIYDPNSPFRDEDIYSVYAEVMSRCKALPAAKAEAYASEAELSSLNRRGTRAADFFFCDKNGRKYRLYDIKAERTILFFSNPGCTACKEIIDVLDNTPGIREAVLSGDFAVLNIYIDEDIQGWKEYMPIYPDSWYNGFDYCHSIRGDVLYNVRAIPSLYLLDENKNVLLKDVPVERLINNI